MLGTLLGVRSRAHSRRQRAGSRFTSRANPAGIEDSQESELTRHARGVWKGGRHEQADGETGGGGWQERKGKKRKRDDDVGV